MQEVRSILSHLTTHPIYGRLKVHRCFKSLKQALPKHWQCAIHFMYVKNGTLFFALKHPGFKMEFDYNLQTIKSLLSSLPPIKEACDPLQIRQVRTFVTHHAMPKSEARNSTVPRYKERSSGRFALVCENPNIRESLGMIRTAILDRHDDNPA